MRWIIQLTLCVYSCYEKRAVSIQSWYLIFLLFLSFCCASLTCSWLCLTCSNIWISSMQWFLACYCSWFSCFWLYSIIWSRIILRCFFINGFLLKVNFLFLSRIISLRFSAILLKDFVRRSRQRCAACYKLVTNNERKNILLLGGQGHEN